MYRHLVSELRKQANPNELDILDRLGLSGSCSVSNDELSLHRHECERWHILERQLVRALAQTRANPKDAAARIKPQLLMFKGKALIRGSVDAETPAPPPKVTKEGVLAVQHALDALSAQESLPGFSTEPIEGLRLAGLDHVADIGIEGIASHTGSDESCISERIRRYGQLTGRCNECLWYGQISADVTAETILDDLIVDDGVESRGHRMTIFDPSLTMAGISIGRHATYGHMVAIEFAAAFTEDSVLQRLRAASGAPSILDRVTRRMTPSGGTQWQLGTCRGCSLEIKGGRVVDCAGLGKFHAQCYKCSRCTAQLTGKDQKKLENKVLFCITCWTELYAPTCSICGKKILSGAVTNGKSSRHPHCTDKAASSTFPALSLNSVGYPSTESKSKSKSAPTSQLPSKIAAPAKRTGSPGRKKPSASRIGPGSVATLYRAMEGL